MADSTTGEPETAPSGVNSCDGALFQFVNLPDENEPQCWNNQVGYNDVNELHCFVSNKMDVMTQDLLVKLCTDFYGKGVLDNTKKLVFAQCKALNLVFERYHRTACGTTLLEYGRHLQPVLCDIRAFDANITTVHLVRDGPTTQYRNKSNFYPDSVIPRKLGYGRVTWNFLEASHGKGAADSIGGVVKSQADHFVAEGNDIPDAASMYLVLLQRTKVQLYVIEEEEFSAFDALSLMCIKMSWCSALRP